MNSTGHSTPTRFGVFGVQDDNLWSRLQSAIHSNGLSTNDVFNCDSASRMRLFNSLGFTADETEALLRITSEREAKTRASDSPFDLAPTPTAAGMSRASGTPLREREMGTPIGQGAETHTGGSATSPSRTPMGAMDYQHHQHPIYQPMNAVAAPSNHGPSSAMPAAGSGMGLPDGGDGGRHPAGIVPASNPDAFMWMGSPEGAANRPAPLPHTTRSATPPVPPGWQVPAPAAAPQPQQGHAGGAGLRAPTPTQLAPSGPSHIRGLSVVGDQLIARCSVYPELPAEFWCCACNVLVSSRCHVQGIHKDHPFITMRVAAEAHVRDLAAWGERCRTQLNVTESVLSNLRHAEGVVQQQGQREVEQLDAQVQQIVEDLMRWKEQLRADMQGQLAAQASAIQTAARRTEELHQLYTAQLRTCEPLLANMPPVDQADRASEDWALRTLDFVSRLKGVHTEPIPMPRLLVPEVTCSATPATHMELLKCVSKPVGVRLPDLVDPGYFNFPQPSASARVPFTLAMPDDAQAKGLVVHNGRTLSRSQDVVPSHTLVVGSQVFYSGVVSWEVHVDRLGTGPGRVLAGIVLHGSDGEGIVWDGQRIVGPNEGECRTLDERYQLRPGTVLRFVLELDGPTCYLSCFFDRDGVARIPVPATGSGWVPAFSVFGPQDQITIVPTSATQRPELMTGPQLAAGARLDGEAARRPPSPATQAKLERQEHLIASLQQQLNAIHARIDNDQFMRTVADANGRVGGDATPGHQTGTNRGQSTGRSFTSPTVRELGLPPTPQRPSSLMIGAGSGAPGARTGSVSSLQNPSPTRQAVEAYSPELKQLMKFVQDVR